MYLLDTNVVSELRKVPSGRADPAVVRWATAVATPQLYLSVVTIQELELGVLLKERRDAAQGAHLRAWLEGQVLPAFAGRILPVTVDIARRCAELNAVQTYPYADSLIAATAQVHALSVVTRNASDFAEVGVPPIDPWETPAG